MESTSGVDEKKKKEVEKWGAPVEETKKKRKEKNGKVKRLDPVPESKRKKKREDRDKGKVWRRKKEKK